MICSSTSFPSARRASASSSDPDGGYSQSELNAISSVRAETLRSALRQRSVAVLPREIEVRQRPRRVEVGVRVEPRHERVGLMPQVALDLELRLRQRVADVVGELQPPAELVAEPLRRQVGDVADHPRDAHAAVGPARGAVVVTALPVGVGHDRVARDRVPRDALRLDRVGAGDRDDRVDLVGVQDRPLERLHAAERSARNGREPLDAELVEERALRPHHVGDGDDGKIRPVGLAGRRIDGRRPGRPAAPSEEVRGDDEVAIGVERLAGADHAVPPAEPLVARTVTIFGAEAVARACRRRRLREPRGVRVAAQRVTDQDHVVACRRERPVGLVGDADRMQLAPAVEPERLRKVEILRFDRAHRAGSGHWR